jgi:alkylhydroperoxidase family enzyme
LARRLGATNEQIASLGAEGRGGFPPAWCVALAYAEAMTPSRGVVEDDLFAELATHWTAAQIVEITAVVAIFNYFNRFAVALHVPVTR